MKKEYKHKWRSKLSEYEKIEWVYSQLLELINGVDVDLETMQLFIEQIRENYFNKNGNLKNKWRSK